MGHSKHPPAVLANWALEETLGSGYSGSIYKATHLHTNQTVALKVQSVDHECPTNRYERGFYPSLQGGVGMPRLWAAGVSGPWDYLAIDLLGSSLDSMFRKSGQDRMDLRSVCCIAMQVIDRLQFMHGRGILHRDIQLGNCTVGLPPNEKTIYMIDFGFSKRYIDPRTHAHIPDSNAKRDFIGNYWFSSVRVHCRGKVPSRRDDIEAVALMLIHLLTPNGLPWTRNGVPQTEPDHDRLKRVKKGYTPEQLCAGIPSEFEEFLRYSRRLGFAEKPDYERWIQGFRDLAQESGFPADDAFVWPPPISVTKQIPPSPRKSTGPSQQSMEQLLRGLAQVEIGDRPVLGDRKNIASAINEAQAQVRKEKAPSRQSTLTGSDFDVTRANATNKAAQLNGLQKEVTHATDNSSLALVVEQFIKVLKINSGRTLTKEALGFLNALHKQLADPSVYIVPLDTRARTQQLKGEGSTGEVKGARVEMAQRLRGQVVRARSNKMLADMVEEFTTVTNQGTARRITSDGFGFLEGLARRLSEIG